MPTSRTARKSLITITLGLLSLALPLTVAAAIEQLGSDVMPTFEAINLTIDADQPDYSGSVRIELNVRTETSSFGFHAEEMTLDDLRLTKDGQAIECSHAEGEGFVWTVTTASPMAVGAYSLEIDFSNNLNTQSTSLYRVTTGGNSYTFTQFEAVDARGAFPCFDEPRFKIPYQLTLVVPEAHETVSNTPIENEQTTDGQKTVLFAKTKPMPTYLLAIATGPLEFVDIPGMSIPGRVVTAKGQSHLTGEAIAITPPILKALEEYHDQLYPYQKLDLIAVPEFWFGAMENAGAIVYKDNLLLIDPETTSPSKRRRLASVTAHELAHMWFGDLVTMVWWDDIWLNESFASWMDTKITQQVFPQFKVDLGAVGSANYAMKTDGRPSTQAVRKPVQASDNMEQIFDVLAYSKGEAVLTMFEKWVGEESMRQGVNNYLKDNVWGNATAEQFWQSLTQATGIDATATMAPFLDQGGVPMVTLEYLGDGQAKITQSRFANYGVEPPEESSWQIPMNISYSDGVVVQNKLVLLSEKSQTIELSTERDMAWIMPNAGASGYYRWNVPSDMLHTMAKKSRQIMATPERMHFLHNLAALLDAGHIRGDDYLKMLSYFADDPDPKVISALMGGLGKVKNSLTTADTEDAFAVYIRSTLGPSLARFGLEKKEGEDKTVTMFRPSLISWLADEGKDEKVMQYALEQAVKFNADPSSIDAQGAETMVYLSALGGDKDLYEDYRARFEGAEVPTTRSCYLYALGSFRDPKIVETALEYVLEGPLRPHELRAIPGALSKYQPHEEKVYQWMVENYAAICERIPSSNAARMPYFAGGCSAERLAAAREFFSEPEHSVPGTEKTFARMSDGVTDCVTLREREGAAVAAYLQQLASN